MEAVWKLPEQSMPEMCWQQFSVLHFTRFYKTPREWSYKSISNN